MVTLSLQQGQGGLPFDLSNLTPDGIKSLITKIADAAKNFAGPKKALFEEMVKKLSQSSTKT